MAQAFRRPSLGVTRKRGRREVVFNSRTDAANTFGEMVSDWSTVHGTRRTNLTPVDSYSSTDAAGRITLATHTLSIRFLAGLTDEMRATVDGDEYEIISVVDPDDLRREQVVEVRRAE